MKGPLERRVEALETTWFGSPKVAAYFRATRAMSGEELVREIELAFSPKFMDSHLRHLNDAERDLALAEWYRMIAREIGPVSCSTAQSSKPTSLNGIPATHI